MAKVRIVVTVFCHLNRCILNSFHLVPLQTALLETDANVRLAELCTSAGEERLASERQL